MDDRWGDSDIVQGLQSGDLDAWSALCAAYSDRLWRYVARLIGKNESSVADVFQETLMAVAKSGRSLRDDSRLWPWLTTIAHNQSALHWRKQSRRQTELLTDESVSQQSADPLLQQEDIESVRYLLAELPAEYVTVLTAKHVDGLSAIEIADQLGEGVQAVRSRLARARREFRKRFEALEAFNERK